MDSGTLREVIEIYRPETLRTNTGFSKTEYKFYRKYRASEQHGAGTRENDNNEVFYTHNKTFFVRYYTDIQDTDRIKYDGKFWTILNIEKNKYFNDKVILVELYNE